jgi:Fe-S cluster assembly protein SufB
MAAVPETETLQGINADYTEKYGFHDAENYLYKAPKGLTRELVAKISSSRTSRSGCSSSA